MVVIEDHRKVIEVVHKVTSQETRTMRVHVESTIKGKLKKTQPIPVSSDIGVFFYIDLDF